MFLTYEKWTKVSVASHDHATVWFDYGTLRIRSVDRVKSVATRWDAIGTYNWGCRVVRFTEDSEATRLIATQMERDDWTVEGLRSNWERHEGSIIVLPCDAKVTNPDTIRAKRNPQCKPVRNRNKAHKRAKAQRFGVMGTTDVALMRHAIETLRLKREGAL